MNKKQIELQFINEFDTIIPDFDKILKNIQSINVPLTPTVERPRKTVNPRYTNVWNRKAQVEISQPKRKIALSFVSLCTCMLLVVVSMFYSGVFALDKDIVIELDKKADSYITLNINPEIDFAVNKFNKITTATAKNDGAKLLLAQMYKSMDVDTLVGMEVNGALMSAIDQATKMGYIDVDAKGVTNAVMIDVISSSPKDSATTKNLLANEAKSYFVDKGIFAIVVTNYDSKAALVEEAKKANPNLDASASVGELISAVEEVEGGKSMYEQEIERIKRENADYSTYLDGEGINRVQYATRSRIQDTQELIAKNSKLLDNLQSMKIAYTAELESVKAKITTLQQENVVLQSEIDQLNSDIDSYGNAGIIKEQIDANKLLLAECSADVQRYQALIANIDNEYEQKLQTLERNQQELVAQIAQSNADITQNNADNTILGQEKTTLQSNIDNLNKEILNANTNIDNYSVKLEQLRGKLQPILEDIDNNQQIADMSATVISLFSVASRLNSVVIPSLESIINASKKPDNCVFCLPEYTMLHMIKAVSSPETLLNIIYDNYLGDMNAALNAAITKLYYGVIADETIFTAEEIVQNQKYAAVQISLITSRAYADIMGTAGMENTGLDDLLANIALALDKVTGLKYANSSFVIDKATVESTLKTYNGKVDSLNEQYLVLSADYDLLLAQILEQQSIVSTATDSIRLSEERIHAIETNISTNIIINTQLTQDIAEYNIELQSVSEDINNINLLKANTLALYNEQLAFFNDRQLTLTKNAIELDKSWQQAVITNKETLQNNISTMANNVSQIAQYTLQSESLGDKIATTIAQSEEINSVNDDNNSLIDALKTFNGEYRNGMRIDTICDDFDGVFNQLIGSIEREIASLRNASEEEMHAEIKNNLDKMSQDKFNKNIEKFENHNQTITGEEYLQWESEQSKIMDEYGWDAIYKAWQEK